MALNCNRRITFITMFLSVSATVKGEIRNRFNLISEERVNISEQNSEILMKIG